MPVVFIRVSNFLARALLYLFATKKMGVVTMIRKLLVVIYIMSVLAISATADAANETTPAPSLGWISK